MSHCETQPGLCLVGVDTWSSAGGDWGVEPIIGAILVAPCSKSDIEWAGGGTARRGAARWDAAPAERHGAGRRRAAAARPRGQRGDRPRRGVTVRRRVQTTPCLQAE